MLTFIPLLIISLVIGKGKKVNKKGVIIKIREVFDKVDWRHILVGGWIKLDLKP